MISIPSLYKKYRQNSSYPIIILWLIVILSLTLAVILPKLSLVVYKKLTPINGMTNAGIYYIAWDTKPKGILVLAPTCNATDGQLIYNKTWQKFARDRKLALVEIAFASNIRELKSAQSYYHANQGSGQLFLSAINDLWGEELPLIMYGFSGGAHFVSRFVEWHPTRVIAWTAYSAGWWDEPFLNAINPPGIVICGEKDERFRATSEYYLQGIKLGKPWLFIGVKNNNHHVDSEVKSFIYQYFDSIWRNYPNKTEGIKTTYGWIPSAELFDKLKTLNSVEPY